MTTSEFASFVLAMLVALILFFGGLIALVELTGNEDLAIPVKVEIGEEATPTSPVPVPPPSGSEPE